MLFGEIHCCHAEKLDLLNSLQNKSTSEQIKVLFQEWDTNRDGYVDFAELALGLSRLGPQQLVGAAARFCSQVPDRI